MSDFTETLHPHHLLELLEEVDRASFELDHFHTAIRAGKVWMIYRRQPHGWLKRIREWKGTRRSIYAALEEMGIEPSRAAEAQLDTLTENSFRVDDSEDA